MLQAVAEIPMTAGPSNTFSSGAPRYAGHGFEVFPVNAGKRPLVAHWREDATRSRGDRGVVAEVAALRIRLGAAARTRSSSTSTKEWQERLRRL